MPTALNDLLKATSRSFYLTLRVLPVAVRPQIGFVPKAQPEISQTRSAWYRFTKYIPSQRDGGNIRTTIRIGNLHRPFRTNSHSNLNQTLRVWLISGVAPRQNIAG